MLGAKEYWLGIWFGFMDFCDFISPTGTNLGSVITFTTIDTYADNGTARFDLLFESGTSDAGGLIIYWNTTTNEDSYNAWLDNELYFLHGVGISATATNDIGALLIGLLFFSLPDVPVLLQIIFVTPLWASIIYVLWYVIKEMIPFV